VPRRRMPRFMYPNWYSTLWIIRLGLHGLVGAFAAILAVVYTTRVFIYDLSIYAYITCVSIKSLHDFHMWDRMHTPQLVGFVFWSCMLLNRIVANAYQGTNILLLQADVLFPTIILAFELIPFPSERFLSFQSGGFLDDWDVATLDKVHPAHLRYLPTDEAHFLRAVRRGDRAEVLRCLGRAGPTVKVLLNRSVTFWGNTAVHLAFRRGDQEMVRLLLSYGADPTVVNDWDEPAIPSADESHAQHMQQLHTAGSDSMAALSRISVNMSATGPDTEPLLGSGSGSNADGKTKRQ
jgi:hypothetical protein